MKLRSSCTRRWGNVTLIKRGKRVLVLTAGSRYSVYRRITNYYNDGEDAFDMRKPLKRDKQRKTVRPNGEKILVSPEEVW